MHDCRTCVRGLGVLATSSGSTHVQVQGVGEAISIRLRECELELLQRLRGDFCETFPGRRRLRRCMPPTEEETAAGAIVRWQVRHARHGIFLRAGKGQGRPPGLLHRAQTPLHTLCCSLCPPPPQFQDVPRLCFCRSRGAAAKQSLKPLFCSRGGSPSCTCSALEGTASS